MTKAVFCALSLLLAAPTLPGIRSHRVSPGEGVIRGLTPGKRGSGKEKRKRAENSLVHISRLWARRWRDVKGFWIFFEGILPLFEAMRTNVTFSSAKSPVFSAFFRRRWIDGDTFSEQFKCPIAGSGGLVGSPLQRSEFSRPRCGSFH